MQEKFASLSKKQKKLLIQLSVFGNEATYIASFFDFYGLNEEENNSFFELIYELSAQKLVVLSDKKFEISSEVEKFIFDNYPPKISNSRVFIEYYLDLLHPPVEKKMSPREETMLLKVISRIQGYSSELAMLADFYAQYLTKLNNVKSAINFYLLAIDIQSKYNELDILMCNYNNHLSEAYIKEKQYEKATDAALKSVRIAFDLPRKDHIILVYSYSLISTIYFKQKNYKLSYEYSMKAIDIAVEKEFDDLLLANLYFDASISATKVKEGKDANKYIHKAFISVMALPIKERNQKLIDKIQLHYQYLELMKKMDNSVLKFAKKTYFYLLVAVVVLLVIILFSI